MLSCEFQFHSNFIRTVQNLIRRRVLQRLIWFWSVNRCSIGRALGLNALNYVNYMHDGERTKSPLGQNAYKETFLYLPMECHSRVWGKSPQGLKPTMTKVSKGAKIRNRYNQVPHLTQDTNGKVTNSQQTPQTRAKRSALSQQVTTKHI